MSFWGAGSSTGDYLRWNAVTGAWRVASRFLRTYQFGAGSLTATAATRFIFPGNGATAPTTIRSLPVGAAGVITGFRGFVGTPSGSVTNVTYTLFLNGVATAMTVTVAANVTNFSASGSVAVLATDRIAIQVTKAAALGTAIVDVDVIVTAGDN